MTQNKRVEKVVEALKDWGWETDGARGAFRHDQMEQIRIALTQYHQDLMSDERESKLKPDLESIEEQKDTNFTPDKRVEEQVRVALGELGGTWEDPEMVVQNIMGIIKQREQDLMSELVEKLEERAVETELHYDMYGMEQAKIIAQTLREAQTIIKSISK